MHPPEEACWAEPRDTAFYRMWKYYLLSSAGQFSARRLQIWQLVLTPPGVPGGYASVRWSIERGR